MNIWLINHYAVPPKYYPLARSTNFAKYLMQMGHTVTIFAASTVHNSDINLIANGSLYREETVNDIHYVYIKCRDYQGNGLSRIYNMFEFAFKLPHVCRNFTKPDAIVASSMTNMACAMGIHIGHKLGCRVVAEITDLWPETLVSYGVAGPHNPAVVALRWLEKWMYIHADAVVFSLEGAYDYIRERGWEKEVPESKVFLINNGVDLELFEYNKARFHVNDSDLDDPDIFKVVYTGSIRAANNLDFTLDIAKKITAPNVRFLLWGDGDERQRLENRVRDEHIDNVVFKGRVDKTYIPDIVSRADANIMDINDDTSLDICRFGISPNKLFDYIAAGKPILMYKTHQYNPGETCNVALVADTEDELTGFIDTMATEGSAVYDMSPECFEAAKQKYCFKNLTDRLISVIEEV